jgi:uncharacterized protein YerC
MWLHKNGKCCTKIISDLCIYVQSRQKAEAIKRRDQGETLADIARSYNVSPATISRLTT